MQEITHFEPSSIFHVVHHAVGKDNLFYEPENYRFFLRKMPLFLDNVWELRAFCLMPNHIHLLVEIKSEFELLDFYRKKYPKRQNPLFGQLQEVVKQQWSNFLNSYSKSFNKRYNRNGVLFQPHPFKRRIDSETYHQNVIRYINTNAVRHGFVKNPNDWLYSSYNTFLSDKETKLNRESVLNLFGGKQAFLAAHQSPIDNDWIREIEFW